MIRKDILQLYTFKTLHTLISYSIYLSHPSHSQIYVHLQHALSLLGTWGAQDTDYKYPTSHNQSRPRIELGEYPHIRYLTLGQKDSSLTF